MSTTTTALGSSPLRTHTPADDSQGNPVLSPGMTNHHTNAVTVDDVARAMRGIAAKKNLSRSDIADATGMTPETVGRKMHGRSPLTVGDLLALAFALDVNPGDLLPVTVPDAPERRDDFDGRAWKLYRDVAEVADARLIDGGDTLGPDYADWAAATHALKVAHDALNRLTARPAPFQSDDGDPLDETDKRDRVDGAGFVWAWNGSCWQHIGRELPDAPDLATVDADAGPIEFHHTR